jgi:hypothetical protein
MKLSQWLDAERGRAARLADRFKVSNSAVSHWILNGVPVARLREVRDFTGGAVTIEEMLEQHEKGEAAA